ncbi:uncharacterized protein LOC125592501 [Brassica napus]|uniref:uncharacterized protein LOC125592501 n=1 Tax=Brassica napus TaxID=3708 RepID=UPI00207A5CAC|nr:uncharacterized protein LOC125592501 [Brassica napus]
MVRVLGRNVVIAALRRKLKELWDPKGEMYVMDLPRQFFMVRFEKESEYLTALTGGPWRLFGSYLIVRAWSPEFDPLRDDIVTTPVWIRLTNIPVNFYHRSILMGIAKELGKPIRVDLTTLNFERARFARVCVEVNLAKPLKGTVLINGERYFVAYEGLSEICSKCGIYGHLVHGCPKTIVERVANPVTQTGTPISAQSTPRQVLQVQGDGFTQVRGPRRGRNTQYRMANITMRELTVEASRNNRENITLTSGGEESENIVNSEENKENHDMNIQNKKGKGILHGKESLIFGGNTSAMTSLKVGTKVKGAGNKKAMEEGRGKAKKLNNRPVRGLVFGPTKGEVSLSESGKRLRVENIVVGRSGGVFRNRVEEVRVMPQTMQLRDEELENPMDSIISVTEQRETDILNSPKRDERALALA